MYDMKKIQKEATNPISSDALRSKRLKAYVVMEMLEPETQIEIEKAFNEFFDKVKNLVPDRTPVQG